MFFDIGANIGRWSMENIHSCDKIICVEASPRTFSKLISNCSNDSIIKLNYAVCNNDGKDITFYHADCDVLSTLNKDWLTQESSRFNNTRFTAIQCKTITLDKLIEIYGKPSLIKIDVEGGEFDCVTSLTQKVDLLCFEWASEVNPITFKCLDYLATLGFQQFYVQMEDTYTFRPSVFYSIDTAKAILEGTTAKVHWGMVWAK